MSQTLLTSKRPSTQSSGSSQNKRVGILGYGEIGKAIAQFYKRPLIKDTGLKRDDFTGNLDILHVCIPWNENFVEAVMAETHQKTGAAGGALVIIHSTVPVGTTRIISDKHVHTVHSPVRGVHPHLHEGIKTFTKYVGCNFSGAGRLATEHLTDLGIKCEMVHKTEATELLKLLSTTYYGLAIAYHQYAKELADKHQVSFDSVMTRPNNTYNEGYWKLGRADVIRPILYPPEGPIGGHCIVPNAQILNDMEGPDPLLEAIIRHQ